MKYTESPIFGGTDNLIYGIFARFFQGQSVHVGTLITQDMQPPAVLVSEAKQRNNTYSTTGADDRFVRPVLVSVDTLTEGFDAHDQGYELQEACRVAIREAWRNQVVIPDGGSIAAIENASRPTRVSDWATASGVVQYPSLPKEWARIQTVYRLIVRAPQNQASIQNRFIQPAP